MLRLEIKIRNIEKYLKILNKIYLLVLDILRIYFWTTRYCMILYASEYCGIKVMHLKMYHEIQTILNYRFVIIHVYLYI